MQLKLYRGQTLVGSIPVNPYKLNNNHYLLSLQGALREEYEDVIDLTDESINFVLDGVPSQVNTFRSLMENQQEVPGRDFRKGKA